ncbi:GerAB/ArcD/ProY family transporter, partial [Bacillus licheniformis]
SLLLVIWIMQLFATFSVSYYAASLGLSQIFKKKSRPIMFGLLPVMYLLAMTPKNIDDVFSLGDMIGYIAAVLFGIVPIPLLLVSKMRKKKAVQS